MRILIWLQNSDSETNRRAINDPVRSGERNRRACTMCYQQADTRATITGYFGDDRTRYLELVTVTPSVTASAAASDSDKTTGGSFAVD